MSFKRVIYTSRRVHPDSDADVYAILAAARRNNGMDGVTGLLWTDKGAFLQLLEGPPDSVDMTFDRISKDPRHADVVVLEESECAERAFGDWAMASFPGEAPGHACERLGEILKRVPTDIARHFAGLCQGRTAGASSNATQAARTEVDVANLR